MAERDSTVSERALIVAAVYGVVGGLWIFLSDEVVAEIGRAHV